MVSKLHLVDLAGSERQKKTKAEGDRLKEGECNLKNPFLLFITFFFGEGIVHSFALHWDLYMPAFYRHV